MNVKLTLRMDQAVIQAAKKEARHKGKSISRMVSDYLQAITRLGKSDRVKRESLPPLTASLVGSLKGAKVTERDYYAYLEKKYR